MQFYTSNLEKSALTDELTNLIDESICKSRYETYDEWRAAIATLLNDLEYSYD